MAVRLTVWTVTIQVPVVELVLATPWGHTSERLLENVDVDQDPREAVLKYVKVGYTVAVNKKFTFRIRTTIVVRTENLRSRSTQFFRTTIADSAIIAVPSKWLNSPTFISGYK